MMLIFYFEKLKVDSSSEDKSWITLNLADRYLE